MNTSVKKYVQELGSYFDASMKKELRDLVIREKRLRVSGLPFCGLRSAYLKMIDYRDVNTTAGKEFYTSIGTAAHLVFQRWLGAEGRIYGDWKCLNKSCGHKVEFSNRNVCPKCKHEMEYEEFTVKYGRHLSGHLDGVYKALDGMYWVIDYKTSSVKNIEAQAVERTFPYASNKVQITSYCALIELIYDIKISGWMLLYIARDNPSVRKIVGGRVSDDQKKRIRTKLRLYNKQYGIVKTLRNRKQLRYLHDTKACKTVEFYDEFMKGFDGCPLAPVCFTKDLLTDTLDLTFEEYSKTVNIEQLNK